MRADGTLAELSKQFYDGADVTVQIEYDFPVIDVSDVD
jgi:cystine transport system substrate-binding protein